MKSILTIRTRLRLLSVVLAVFLLCGCVGRPPDSSLPAEKNDYRVGVWISYSEMNTMLADGGLRQNFKEVLDNCEDLCVTDLFVHVRAFCDSVYPSDYFPMTAAAAVYDFDVLEYIVTQAHDAGIRVHAWINPYRVRTADQEIDALPEKSPVRQWLTDEDPENDSCVCFSEGIYLNPAASGARRLVVNGIRELVSRYKIDGIHFDDYFYPTDDPAFDADTYAAYCADASNPLPLDDWRRANVNMLISGCYTAVKFSNRNLIFSISPAASIENNKIKLYADVEAWIASGCVDWLIPQLYFSFTYPKEEYRFDTLLSEWRRLAKKGEVELLIGLASYKIGTGASGLPDEEEWKNDPLLIAREAELCRKSTGINGHIFFSYSSLFGSGEEQTAARQELLARQHAATK